MSSSFPSRGLGQFHGRTHFPVARGPYSVATADVACQAGAAATHAPAILVRLFYPHQKHDSHSNKVAALRASVEKWPSWYPEERYASGYAAFKWPGLSSWPFFYNLVGGAMRWLSQYPIVPVIENAAVAVDKERFPVLVFSHGNGSCRMTYSTLCAEVASRGFVVAAVEHADGSACVGRTPAAEGGQVLEWVEPGPASVPDSDTTIRPRQVAKRASECHGTLAMLAKIDDKGVEGDWIFSPGKIFDVNQLRGRLNVSDGVVVCGHSFGGATAVKALLGERDDESSAGFIGAYCLDSWLFPIKGERPELAARATVDKPLFFLNYETFQGPANLAGMRLFETKYTSHEEPCNVATVKAASHYAASDVPPLLSRTRISTFFSGLSWLGRFMRLRRRTQDEIAPLEGEGQSLDSEATLVLTQDMLLGWLARMGFLTSPALPEDDAREQEVSLSDVLHRAKPYLLWGTRFRDKAQEDASSSSQKQ